MPSVSDFFGSWYYKMKVGKAVKEDTTSQCRRAFYDWYQLYLQILFFIFLNPNFLNRNYKGFKEKFAFKFE